jgi:[ribosomal protein S18]-alanine N-acetyltransferase
VGNCVLVGYDCRVLELAEQNKKIVGYSISRYHHHGYHILNFCIAKEMQSRGLGSQFLQTICDSLSDNRTVDHVILEVRASNYGALHLYRKMGFEQIDVKEDYYKDTDKKEDALVLKKKLI